MEEEIWKDLQRGISWNKIAKKYRVAKSTIQRIKQQGKYYLNLDTGEEEFSAKKISIERQIYHYLLYNELIEYQSKLSEFLGVDSRNFSRWKHVPKLVILDEVKRFLDSQQIIIKPKKKNRIGLYFLYQNHKLMYIGKSKDINKRLYQHSHNSHIEGLEGTYDVKIILIGNEKDTELAERVYISILKPPLNKEFVDELECGGFFSELMNRIPKGYSRRIEIKEKR